MKILAKVVVGCVVLGSALVANQGCGCGPIQGAYFTSEVLRYDATGQLQAPAPGLLQPRAFATAIPLADGEHYLVVDGFIAEKDGDPADDAHAIELCSVASGCVLYGETEDTNQDVFVARPGAAFLTDGTVVSPSFVVRGDASGYVLTRASYAAVVQAGERAVVQDRGTVSVFRDAATPPRSLGVFAGHVLAAAIDDDHVLLLSTGEAIVLDLTTGTVDRGPGPGPRARIETPIPVAGGVVVLDDHNGLRYDVTTKTWRMVPALAGERWTVELTSTRGEMAILSAGDPDPEAGIPYRAVYYDPARDSVISLPATPPFDLGATWLEMSDGVILRIGGARAWFDTIAGLAAS